MKTIRKFVVYKLNIRYRKIMAENINNQYIEIKGARVHNLKNIDLQIPRSKMVVITGLSGSGKSSLAFDTLYAEGQRRYVESLSSYARQFLGRMDKPDVDYIKGIPPAIAIEQKVNTRNPRSTVGTSTEIYDYIKLLYARIGRTYSPITGKEVIRHEVSDVVGSVFSSPVGTKVFVLAPFVITKGRTLAQEADLLQQQGFTRLEIQGEVIRIADLDEKLSSLIPFYLGFGLDRSLAQVRVLRADINTQFPEHRRTQAVARQHTADGMLQRPYRFLFQRLVQALLTEPARIARVAVVKFIGALLAGEGDLGSVDNDDAIAVVQMSAEGRFMLALQPDGGLRGYLPQDLALSIDDMPLALDIPGF